MKYIVLLALLGSSTNAVRFFNYDVDGSLDVIAKEQKEDMQREVDQEARAQQDSLDQDVLRFSKVVERREKREKNQSNMPKDNTNLQLDYRPNSIQSPWATNPAASAKNDITGAFGIWESGSHYYTRNVPENFAGSEDDRLMNSLIYHYSLEGRGDDDKANGKFFLTKNGFQSAAEEVVKTHLHMDAEKSSNYVKDRLDTIWNHVDVLKKGYLFANEGPQMLRMMLGEVEVNNALQV